MKLKRTTLNLEVRADEQKMEFEGVANGFGTIDCYGCIMARGAFKQDLPQFLSDGFIGGINHDWNNPIGKPLAASEDAAGLNVKAKLSDTAAGRESYTLMKDGVLKRLSVGFEVKDGTWLETPKDVENYWSSLGYPPSDEDVKNSKYGAFLMNRVQLFEFSPVLLPGNALTEISNVLSAPLAGRPLEDHLNSVLAADEELRDRIIPLLQKRSDEGRKLSAMWQARLEKLVGEYSEILALAKAGNVDLARNARMNDALAREYLVGITTN